eukprot:14492069-Alexandrium_andersonii.AAC.1
MCIRDSLPSPIEARLMKCIARCLHFAVSSRDKVPQSAWLARRCRRWGTRTLRSNPDTLRREVRR